MEQIYKYQSQILYSRIVRLHVFELLVFSLSVKVELAFCIKTLLTLITRIAECIWKVLGLNMVSCQRFYFMRKLFTKRAMELLIQRVSPYKLKQLTGVLKGLS